MTGPNTILLFEVLDNPPSTRRSHGPGGTKGKLANCLAWGYLLPRGLRAGRLNFAVPSKKVSNHVATKFTPYHHCYLQSKSADLKSDQFPADEDAEDATYLPTKLQLYEYRFSDP